MKILIVCQHYYPDRFRITDIAEELVKRGNDVFVLAGTPSYEYDEWLKAGSKIDEVRNGVNIHRVKTVPRGKGIIRRVRNYYSFAINSKRYVKKLDKDFDVVFVYELSPIMMAEAAIKYKKKYKTKIVLYCLDLWPKSLTAGGIKENSPIYKYYKKVSAKIYGAADELLVTSESFKDYFCEEFGFDKETIKYLPQYAESVYDAESCKKVSDDYCDLMFAGNVGVAQSVETIIETASLLKNNDKIRFHIVGDGIRLENCKRIASENGLNNVTFYGRLPLEQMPDMYSKADAMLVTGDSGVVSQTLPAKVQGYMAAGKTIIGAIGGETATVIEKASCGYCGEAENAEALKENILKFFNLNKNERAILSENGLDFNAQNFNKDSFYICLISIFKKNIRKDDYLFLTGIYPKESERRIYKQSRGMPQTAADVFQKNIIFGFDSNLTDPIKLLNAVFIGSFPVKSRSFYEPSFAFKHCDRADDFNVGFLNICGVKRISRNINIRFFLKDWCRESNGNKYFFAYACTDSSIKAVEYVKKHNKSAKTCLFVPDLPQYMNLQNKVSLPYKILKKIDINSINRRINYVDYAVFLTKQMADILPIKKYTVIEGISSDLHIERNKNNKKIITYAGGMNEAYGVLGLIDAFMMIEDENLQLNLCGSGDIANKVIIASQKDTRIKFYGAVPRNKVLACYANSDLLVNPRTNSGEFTKYSFPSKILEYMSTGIPTACFKLSGIPDEYDDFLYYFNDDNPVEMARFIKSIIYKSSDELNEFGTKARKFVLQYKNAYNQIKKVIDMIQD